MKILILKKIYCFFLFELNLLIKVDNLLVNFFFIFIDFVFYVDGIDMYVVTVDVGSEKIDI